MVEKMTVHTQILDRDSATDVMDIDGVDSAAGCKQKKTEQAVSPGDIDSESEQAESYTFASQHNDQEEIFDMERLQELRDSSLGEATKWIEDGLKYAHRLSETGNVKVLELRKEMRRMQREFEKLAQASRTQTATTDFFLTKPKPKKTNE
ncbi:hypothetical protein SARC_08541 [Sphaeroforma arctica JP610]|uniref:Uncharacterized protein n=1 Tax=Sphaeroforma arctica JP610 TaxID=667725 RepID=A0A0L0FQR9_9EUKA|nr:hypothetical protein SARC_08541 [Sphaeroforma arctica JP610]KNC79054.1 hypothetical protein SARC_08541 [Sphaeroforma arctica JP610]|eukprot:XP_014152956.1 hypothetical protein SARC_08541 [Sphaeroforma arctica JP610]